MKWKWQKTIGHGWRIFHQSKQSCIHYAHDTEHATVPAQNDVGEVKHFSTQHRNGYSDLYFSAQEDRRTLESKIANLERENSDLRRDIRELRVNYREITMDYRDLDYDYQHLLVDSPNEPIRGYRGTYYHINSIMIIPVWHRFINRYNIDVFNH